MFTLKIYFPQTIYLSFATLIGLDTCKELELRLSKSVVHVSGTLRQS